MIRRGNLVIVDAAGGRHNFGDGSGPRCVVRFADRRLEWELALRPDPVLGEAYMDRRLLIEEGALYDFVDVCAGNAFRQWEEGGARMGLYAFARLWHQYNPITRSLQNVAHHYDLSDALYDRFLDDAARQYTCAYFSRPDMSIEQAQVAKLDLVARKLLLEPGQKVIDLGCGWGGLGMYLAAEHEVDVTGVTLSIEQVKHANRCAAERGLAAASRFLHLDYRQAEGVYDRVVSVGILEHVGIHYYDTFFQKVADLMADDGVGLVHSIGRMRGPAWTSRFIRKYIFPGGYIPALSEVMPSIERAGLWVTDMEILRLHYAFTLRAWRERFYRHWDEVASIYDERFCRMWEMYLVCSELFFRRQDGMIFQVQLAKRRDTVPLTRDYLLAPREAADPTHMRAAE